MRTRPVFCVVLCIAIAAFGEDFRNKDGKVIVSGSVTRVEPDGLMIRTPEGIEKIGFGVLDEPTQKRFGYDQNKAIEFRRGLTTFVTSRRSALPAGQKRDNALTDSSSKDPVEISRPTPASVSLLDQRKAVQDIVCSTMRGTNIMRVRRWVDSPSVSCMFNRKTDQFEHAITEINKALAPSRYELRPKLPKDAKAQIKFYYVTSLEFAQITTSFGCQASNRAYFWHFWWDSPNGELSKAIGLVNIESLSEEKVEAATIRVLLGTLGFCDDTKSFSETIFSSPPKGLSEFDRKLLPFFYMHLDPNAQAFDVWRAFDAYWNRIPASSE